MLSLDKYISSNNVEARMIANVWEILAVGDSQEFLEETQVLLEYSGYVCRIQNQIEKVEGTLSTSTPDLILVSLGDSDEEVANWACNIRRRSGLGNAIPIVIFSRSNLPVGAEIEIDGNVHLTVPDNIDQLRAL